MAVCIAGMHRSGTSMLARMVNLCGLYLGTESDLIPAANDNPEGFWEHARLSEINNQILYRLGGGWDVVPHLEPGWASQSRFDDLKISALPEIQNLARHPSWGWKDPRNSLTFEFWSELIPDLKYLICVRDPYEVYRSLTTRGYASPQFAYQLWVKYYEILLEGLSPSQYLVTHYDTYFHDPVNELRRISAFAGLNASEHQIQEACHTISPSQKHHVANTLESEIAEPPHNVMALYARLCALAGPVYHSTDPESFALAQVHDESFEYQRKISNLKKEFQKKEEVFQKTLQQKEAFLQQTLQQKEKVLEGKESEIINLQTQLAEILNSRGWRTLHRLQRIRAFFIPLNSRREKLLKFIFGAVNRVILQPAQGLLTLVARSYAVIRTEGWKSFLGKVRRKLVIKNDHPEATLAEMANQPPALIETDLYRQTYNHYLRTAITKNGADEYVSITKNSLSTEQKMVKLIAFYLPQFHPIPENDAWWGRGFTEWSNVSKAVPQYIGHYQPQLPDELGFYDLRLAAVQEQQVELAQKYGLHGFAFYYYWFNGKRLLEKPLENYLNNPNITFPFCICWANENWTRRWDGLENDILIAQNHTDESDLAFIRDLAPILRDPRYIRINGRPLIIVYRAQLLPRPAHTARLWREYCLQEGFENPYLVAVQVFGLENPHELGFDAAIEFPPINMVYPEITSSVKTLNPQFQGKVYRYYDAMRSFCYRSLPSYKLFRGVMPGWDNEARKPGRGFSFAFSTPHAYQNWLTYISQETIRTETDPNKRLIFVNAWNEWAEGAHLEPDRKYGYAYLQATMNALTALSENDTRLEKEKQIFGKTIRKKHDTAVFLHMFYPDMWDELSQHLGYLSGDFDLFISIPDSVQIDTKIFTDFHPDTYIYRCKNRGRDVAPFLQMYNVTVQHQYQQALKLHTKKSKHREDGDKWRIDLYKKLMGSRALIQNIQKTFTRDAAHQLGILAPDGHVVSSEFYLSANKANIEKLARLANLNYFGEEFQFVAGSMFWFRMESFFPLSLLPLGTDDFETESGQVDGTLAHAFERIFGLLMSQTGYKFYVSDGTSTNPLDDNGGLKKYPYARPHINQ